MQYLTLPLFHYFLLRLYSVLRADDASGLPSSTQTSQSAITPEMKSNIVRLTAVLTFGLLVLAVTLLGAFYLRRQRRRMPALLDTPSTSPNHTLDDQLSGTTQESELRSQPTQPPTHGSTLSPSAPTATAVPTTSIGNPESGMPPSHLGLTFPAGGLSRFGEVAKKDLAPPVEVIEILDEDEEQGDKPPKVIRWWDVAQSKG